MIEVYAVKLKHFMDTQLLNRFLLHLSEEKRNRINNFHKIEDAKRTLIADILVRISACNKLGIKNKDMIFEKNEYGKPYLKGFNDFCFNISHSYEWIVCAIHNYPVGIDIEIIRPIDLTIAERFYSRHEFNEILNREDSKRIGLFYDLWTLRESYVKAIGMGLYMPFDSFSFNIYDDYRIELIKEFTSIEYYFKRYNIDEKYKMAVCSSTKEFPQNVIFKEIDETFDKSLLE